MDTFLNSPIAPHVSSKMVRFVSYVALKKWYFYLLELGFEPSSHLMGHGTISFLAWSLQWLLEAAWLLVAVLQSPTNMAWMLNHWKPFNSSNKRPDWLDSELIPKTILKIFEILKISRQHFQPRNHQKIWELQSGPTSLKIDIFLKFVLHRKKHLKSKTQSPSSWKNSHAF